MSPRKICKCRFCFTSGIFHINIFDKTKNIVEAVQDIFRLELNEDDSLPNFICVECWMTIQNFHKFYQKVLETQRAYLNVASQSIKLEISSDADVNTDEIAVVVESFPFSKCDNLEQVEVIEPASFEHSMKTDDFDDATFDDNSTNYDGLDVHDNDSSDANNSDYDDNQLRKIDSDDELLEIKRQSNIRIKQNPLLSNEKRKRGRPRKEDKIAQKYNEDALESNEDSDDENYSDSDEYQSKDDESDDDFVIKKLINKNDRNKKGTINPILPNGKRKRGRPRKEVKVVRKGPRGIFPCPYCEKWFTRKSRVNVHIAIKHGHQCDQCDFKAASELKLRQHKCTHDPEFENKLRKKLDDLLAIDVNAINADEVERITKMMDMSCDMCSATFECLNEAHSHYLTSHNLPRGYIKCCDLKIREECYVREHIAYHTDPDMYHCFCCDITLKLKSHFRIHLKNHITELLEGGTNICSICGKPYASKSSLAYHKAEVHTHKSDKIKCKICNRTFIDEQQKEKHMRNAHDEISPEINDYIRKNFNMSCDVCDKIFDTFVDAKLHYLAEHQEPRGYIQCCNVKFRTLKSISQHVDFHKNPEQFRCTICNLSCKTKDQLGNHILRHGRSYTCERCGKVFRRKTGLRTHLQNVHEPDARNFQCRFCSLRFATDEKRNSHEQLIHYGNTTGAQVVCDICGKGFHQVSHLNKHIEKYHNGKEEIKPKEPTKSEKCTICGLWLSSRYRLKLHRKSHSMEPNKCRTCGVIAPNHDALLGHVRAFHVVRKKNWCRLCDITFKETNELQEHIVQNHPEEKLYRCVLCLESFVWKVSLDAHMKKAHPDHVQAEKTT